MLIDFLCSRYQFRFNTIMGYTEYKDNSLHYCDWQPVDDRALKGLTMKVRLAGIDARDNDVRRYEQDGTWMSASAIFSLSATKTLSATTLKCL